MELSPRLQAVADWVPAGAKLADIGTDHGYLPVWLITNQRITEAVAADLRAGPLDAARRTAQRFGIDGQISFRLCDGLTGIQPGEVDTVAIAGMGGETIAGILESAPWTREEDTLLLLQPQTAFFELRDFLSKNGYRILNEKIIREGYRLYIAIEAKHGDPEEMNAGELWAGKNSNDPLRGEYLTWISGVLQKALHGKQQAVHTDEAELAQLRQALGDIQMMKKEWESWQ